MNPQDRAFPSAAIDDRYGGMTKLEYFAGQAVGSIIITATGEKVDAAIIAEGAFAVAEAMIAESAKRRTQQEDTANGKPDPTPARAPESRASDHTD